MSNCAYLRGLQMLPSSRLSGSGQGLEGMVVLTCVNVCIHVMCILCIYIYIYTYIIVYVYIYIYIHIHTYTFYYIDIAPRLPLSVSGRGAERDGSDREIRGGWRSEAWLVRYASMHTYVHIICTSYMHMNHGTAAWRELADGCRGVGRARRCLWPEVLAFEVLA